jgi:hypothetical protein
MATQSPNGDYVAWKHRSRKPPQKLHTTFVFEFWKKKRLKLGIFNRWLEQMKETKWKFSRGNGISTSKFSSRDESKKKGRNQNSLVISFNVSLSRHWGWPRTSSSRPRDFERCSQFVCLLLRNFNSNTKKNQNVDDWPSWPTTNSKNTRIFVRLHYNELIQNLPFHVRMQILTRHHLLWVMADFVRSPGCGSCSLVAVSLQFISGWQEVVARTRFEAESK